MKKAPKVPATLLPDNVAMSSAVSAPEIPLKAAEDGTIHLAGDDGHFYAFPANSAASALQDGFRPLTPAEEKTIEDKKTYGDGVVNSLEAGALGFLRGATLGLSDAALRALEPKWADAAENLKKYHKTASTIGELSSFVVPALAASKVAGVAGKAVGSTNILQKLVAGGADEIGSVASKIVGENLAGKAIGAGVKIGAEAAVYQAAHNISENSLEDKELTAESILAGTGQAAILGAGIGAALPVLAYGAQKAGEKILSTKTAQNALNFFDPERATQLYAGATKKQFGDLGTKWRRDVEFLRKEGAFERGEVTLDRFSGELKSTGGSLPGTDKGIDRLNQIRTDAGQALGDAYRLADEALHQETIAIGTDPHWAVKSATQAKEARSVAREIIDDVTTLSPGARKQITQSINDIARNSPLVDAKPLRAIVGTYERALRQTGGSLERIKELTTQLGEDISLMKKGAFTGGVEVPPKVEVLQQIRSALRDNLNYALERLQQEQLYRGGLTKIAPASRLNKIFSAATSAVETMEDAAARTNGNVNVLGLRFRDIGIGAIGGGVLGGPAGIGIAVANRAMQTGPGLLWRAEIGEKLQKLAWAEKLTEDGQRTIADGLKAFIRGDSAGAVSEGLKKYGAPLAWSLSKNAPPGNRIQTQQQWFDETKKQLLAFAADTDSFAAEQGNQLQSLADHAPQVADAVLLKQLQIHSYLLQAMPKNPSVPLSVKNDKWQPADYQIQDFRRVVQVARAPLTIMNDLRAGTATQGQVQAIKTLYPKLYESILTQVRALVDSEGTHLSYPQQLKLGQLFPGSIPTMQPGFIAAMQNPAAKPEEKAAKPGGQVQFSQRRQTQSERSESR